MENTSAMHGESSSKSEGRTITLRLPKISGLSLQTVVLLLLILVGGLQTVQLYGLKNAVAGAKVSPSVAVPSGGSEGSSSSLPSMVGGC